MAKLPNVLSVEDDAGLFRLIQLTLRPLPIQLHHANSGAEALRLIDEIRPEVIILDITLPDMRGWDVLDQVATTDLDVKGVIVVTGRTETAHRVIARLQDVTGYLNKPFKPAELREKVIEVLNLAPTS
jgi:DNA-binding response OmpR family regulator